MLKLKKGYRLHNLAGVPYLLPYGQNIADFKRSVRLNESGLLLYHELLKGADKPSLLESLISHYEADAKDIPILKEDVDLFLFQLKAAGILASPETLTAKPSDLFLRIGPATIACQGPRELFAPSFSGFSCESGTPDLIFKIIPSVPDTHVNGEILIRTKEMVICRNDASYLFLYPDGYGLTEMHVSLNGKQAVLFCPQPHADGLTEQIFHAVRFAYLICAQNMGAFAIHSASILYRGKAWLFSGPSGAGKSTHASLWEQQFQTPLLNGDLNLLCIVDGKPMVYGIPWCGTSGHYTTKTVPLGGITFLKQAPKDALLPLTNEDITLRAMQRLITPSWTEDMLLTNLSFVETLQKDIPFFHLQCTKEASAAETLKQAIDSYL